MADNKWPLLPWLHWERSDNQNPTLILRHVLRSKASLLLFTVLLLFAVLFVLYFLFLLRRQEAANKEGSERRMKQRKRRRREERKMSKCAAFEEEFGILARGEQQTPPTSAPLPSAQVKGAAGAHRRHTRDDDGPVK